MSANPMMHNLPVEAYTSQEWFDREQKNIFSRTWAYAGFKEDLTVPGQYKSVQAGLNNIFIVMGRDRTLRAFHNICRHRGTQLIRAVGKSQKALTCPYHDWTYDLDGKLIAIPDEHREYKEGVDKSCLNLLPASVDIWQGMIFVHPDPEAGPISSWFGDVDPHIGISRVEQLPETMFGKRTYEIKANWKIVVENYIDVYHLSHLHSGTLHMYDHAKAEYSFIGPHYVFREPPSREYGEDIRKNAPFPLIVPAENAAAWVPMMFPGIGVAVTEAFWSCFIITPLAPDLTRVETRARVANASMWEFAKQMMRASGFWTRSRIRAKFSAKDANGKNDPLVRADFMGEDIYACEQQQKSMKSPYFRAGPAGEGESPVIDHQRVVLEWMDGPPEV